MSFGGGGLHPLDCLWTPRRDGRALHLLRFPLLRFATISFFFSTIKWHLCTIWSCIINKNSEEYSKSNKFLMRNCKYVIHKTRGVTGIFFWRGKVIFPDFFPGVKCFFPVENSHLVDIKQIFVVFKSEKQKTNKQTNKTKQKQKKNPSPLFITFPTYISNFPPSLLQFFFLLFLSIFTPFPFFPCLFFPDTSVLCPPRLLCHCIKHGIFDK